VATDSPQHYRPIVNSERHLGVATHAGSDRTPTLLLKPPKLIAQRECIVPQVQRSKRSYQHLSDSPTLTGHGHLSRSARSAGGPQDARGCGSWLRAGRRETATGAPRSLGRVAGPRRGGGASGVTATRTAATRRLPRCRRLATGRPPCVGAGVGGLAEAGELGAAVEHLAEAA
jgi:hypothetical protein